MGGDSLPRCASMNETLMPKQYSVEGEIGWGDGCLRVAVPGTLVNEIEVMGAFLFATPNLPSGRRSCLLIGV